ncbi:MAG: hypothetical protein ABI658_10155 [Acidimicrobiales bacterium]
MSTVSRFARRSRRRTVVGLALAASVALSAVVSIGAASAAVKEPSSTPTSDAPHCLTRVTGKLASGELQLSTPQCYATYADVLLRAGVPAVEKTVGGGGAVALGGTWIIGTHFDGANFTGASISVQGSDCNGGYINLTGWWANRVSSTLNGCPTVRHFYWPNLGGTSEDTTGYGGNLFSLSNLSESIAYLG